jgi:hypothetical protein
MSVHAQCATTFRNHGMQHDVFHVQIRKDAVCCAPRTYTKGERDRELSLQLGYFQLSIQYCRSQPQARTSSGLSAFFMGQNIFPLIRQTSAYDAHTVCATDNNMRMHGRQCRSLICRTECWMSTTVSNKSESSLNFEPRERNDRNRILDRPGENASHSSVYW